MYQQTNAFTHLSNEAAFLVSFPKSIRKPPGSCLSASAHSRVHESGLANTSPWECTASHRITSALHSFQPVVAVPTSAGKDTLCGGRATSPQVCGCKPEDLSLD
jgi:hypothetical protein